MLGVTFIVFFIQNIRPGDPARELLGNEATEEEIYELREELGLNDPFLERYVDYVCDTFFRFDFGTSWRTRLPIGPDVVARIKISFLIALLGITGAVLIGVPIGVLSAVKQYSFVDNISRIISIFFSTVPSFWLAMMLAFIFAVKLHLLPSSGADGWECYILPTISLALPYSAMFVRMTRSTVLETIRSDYVRTAHAKGLPVKRVIFQHALRNAWLPVITLIATNFGALFGSAVITESVFNMPGLGTMMTSAVKQFDTPVVMAGTLVLSFICGFLLLVGDIIGAYVDPRVKAKYSK